MMDRTLKLQRMLAGFSNFDSGLGDAFKSVEAEMKRVADKLRQEADTKAVKDVKKIANGVKEELQIAINSLFNAFDTLKSELNQNEKDLTESLNNKLDLLKTITSQFKNASTEQVRTLASQVASLQENIKEISQRKIEFPDFTPQINAVKSEFKKEILKLQEDDDSQETKDFQDKLDKFEKELVDIRNRTLLRQSLGGGQANRNILVAGNSSTLSRYTDLNIKAGGGVTLTHTNNDTLKTTDLTIASPGGATAVYGEIVSGSGTSWTLAHTPVGSIALYVQGTRISSNRGDFTIIGTAITTAVSYTAGDLEADYSY